MAVHALRGMNLPTWGRLLRQHRVDRRHLGRFLDVSLTSLACFPMDVLEELATRGRRRRVSIERPVFILGHWRSGTTLLQQLMTAHQDLGYVSSFHCGAAGRFLLFRGLWRWIMELAAPRGRPQDDVTLSPQGPAEEDGAMVRLSDQAFDHCFHFPRDWARILRRGVLLDERPDSAARWKRTYRDFLARVTLDLEGRRLLLKSPANTARLAPLLELFPDARFVHIVRSPYEVFYSSMRMWRTIIAVHSFQDVDEADIQVAVLTTYREVMRRFRETSAPLTEATLMELRYEDLLADPERQLESVFDWLGCPLDAPSRARLRHQLEGLPRYAANVHHLTEAGLDLVEAEWGEFLAAYGYPRPPAADVV